MRKLGTIFIPHQVSVIFFKARDSSVSKQQVDRIVGQPLSFFPLITFWIFFALKPILSDVKV